MYQTIDLLKPKGPSGPKPENKFDPRDHYWYCDACDAYHSTYFEDCPMNTDPWSKSDSDFEAYLIYPDGFDVDVDDDTYFRYPHTSFMHWMQDASLRYDRMIKQGAKLSDDVDSAADISCYLLYKLSPADLNINGSLKCLDCDAKFFGTSKDDSGKALPSGVYFLKPQGVAPPKTVILMK